MAWSGSTQSYNRAIYPAGPDTQPQPVLLHLAPVTLLIATLNNLSGTITGAGQY